MTLEEQYQEAIQKVTEVAGRRLFELDMAAARLALSLEVLEPQVAHRVEEAIEDFMDALQDLLPEGMNEVRRALKDDYLGSAPPGTTGG